jgi:uncharacterized protein YgiM (DUF1202 family)
MKNSMLTNNPTFDVDSGSKKFKVDNCGFLNLRKKPNRGSVCLVLLKKDEEVDLVAKINDQWVKVKTSSGKSGFVMSDYLSDI